MSPGGKASLIAAGILAASAFLALGYHVASQRPEPMEVDQVARVKGRIASLAAETQLLAEALLADRVTAPYARTHRQRLEDEVHDQERELDKPMAPGIDADRLRALRGDLQAQLEQMQQHLSEPEAVGAIRGEAERIGQQLERERPR